MAEQKPEQKQDEPEALQEFTFGRAWRHAGKDYKAGDKADLSANEIAKLKRYGADKAAPEQGK